MKTIVILVTLKTKVKYLLYSIYNSNKYQLGSFLIVIYANNLYHSEQIRLKYYSHDLLLVQHMGENDQNKSHRVLLNIYASLNHCISLHGALKMKSKNFQMNEHTMTRIILKYRVKLLMNISNIPSLTLYDCFIRK